MPLFQIDFRSDGKRYSYYKSARTQTEAAHSLSAWADNNDSDLRGMMQFPLSPEELPRGLAGDVAVGVIVARGSAILEPVSFKESFLGQSRSKNFSGAKALSALAHQHQA